MTTKKRKRSKSKTVAIPPVSDQRYEEYLLALEQGEELARQGKKVFWDVGKGERPAIVLAHFRQVARKENIPVIIKPASKDRQSLVFRYPAPSQTTQKVRVRNEEGTLKAVKEIHPAALDG